MIRSVKPVLIAVMLFIACAANAQTSSSADQEKVNETITRFFDGISELDFDKMKSTTTNDVIVLENGAVWNMDSLVNVLTPLKTKGIKRSNAFDFIRTDVKGNTAWVSYNNTATFSMNEKQMTVQWMESAVLVKENKEWKIKLLHSTKLPPKGKTKE